MGRLCQLLSQPCERLTGQTTDALQSALPVIQRQYRHGHTQVYRSVALSGVLSVIRFGGGEPLMTGDATRPPILGSPVIASRRPAWCEGAKCAVTSVQDPGRCEKRQQA